MSTQRTDSPDASSAEAALPDFTPVPLRHRRDGWTPERQRRYVALLAETGLAGKAARAVGMTTQSAARLRRRPEGAAFDAACAAAQRAARRRWKKLRESEAGRSRSARRFEKFFKQILRAP